MTRARLRLGAAGEEQACAWYQAHGYSVVARNWRCRDGELDVVARRGPVLVVCEVKTRSSDAFGHPAEAVTPAKQQRIRRLARTWMDQARHNGELAGVDIVRFDVAAILAGRLEMIEGAF